MTKVERKENDEETQRDVSFWRQYAVFNLEQTEDMPERFLWPTNDLLYLANESEAVEIVDGFFRNIGAEIVHGTDVPYYSIFSDQVHMPPRQAFQSMNDYFGLLSRICG